MEAAEDDGNKENEGRNNTREESTEGMIYEFSLNIYINMSWGSWLYVFTLVRLIPSSTESTTVKVK